MAGERSSRVKIGISLLAGILAIFAVTLGVTTAFGMGARSSSTTLPCEQGGDHCIHIGYTKAWLNGKTVTLEYSHRFFCEEPPSSASPTNCEAGAKAQSNPSSGAVVSNLYVLVPMGFTPPADTLQCPTPGHCIDHPHSLDMSRVFGSSSSDVTLPAHSHVLEDDESFQSTWWPVVVVGVKSLDAWKVIAKKKTSDAMDHCEAAGHCTSEIPTNIMLFFQVLGPGGSAQGPA